MNRDKLKFWLVLLLFPLVYFGVAASYSYYDIYELGHYERKSGRWGSFQISLAVFGFMTLMASVGYWIGLAWLKSEPQQLPRLSLALISVLSALLSWVVMRTFIDIEFNIPPELLWLVCVWLFPALLGVILVKIHRICFVGHRSIQR